jgi:hypothetical protein
LVVVVEALMECPDLEVGVEPVLDLEVAVVLLMVFYCQQKEEARQTCRPQVSPRLVRVSLVVAEAAEVLDSQHSTKLALCSVGLEEDWRISQLLQSGVVL